MRCQSCGTTQPTTNVTLYQQIGMLVMRRTTTTKAVFCRTCLAHYFWSYMFTTSILGWWGLISFFLTPILLIGNVAQAAMAWRRLAASPVGMAPVGAPPSCPQCQTYTTTGAGLGTTLVASCVIGGLILLVDVQQMVTLAQQHAPVGDWVLPLAVVVIAIGAAACFLMLRQVPLRRCTNCGFTWPMRA